MSFLKGQHVAMIDDKSLKIFQRKALEEESKAPEPSFKMDEEFLLEEPGNISQGPHHSRKIVPNTKMIIETKNDKTFKPF